MMPNRQYPMSPTVSPMLPIMNQRSQCRLRNTRSSWAVC